MIMNVIYQGLIFSLVAMAVYTTSRVIRKDDLSVEGSFLFGGAITAALLSHGVAPALSLLIAFFCGAVLGALTGVLFTRCAMNHLMAGLTTTTACFSLGLATASAHKNITGATIFSGVPEGLVLGAIIALIYFALVVLFRSQVGLLLHAVGDNPNLLAHIGKDKGHYQTLGFIVANAITALAGSLFVQWSGFFSITGAVGTLIAGLTSLMIGELFVAHLSLLLVGASIAYQSIFAACLLFGIPPVWNNAVKAIIIVALVLCSRHAYKKRRSGVLHKQQPLATLEPTIATDEHEPEGILAALQVTHIRKSFDQTEVLRDVTFRAECKELTILEGQNGAGKSTLFHVIAGSMTADGGEILLGSCDIGRMSALLRSHYLAVLQQDPKAGTIPSLTVMENLLLAWLKNRRPSLKKANDEEARSRIRHHLEDLGLAIASLDGKVSDLSGGQRQIIAFAMATLVRPRALLLDEPTAALDDESCHTLMKLVKRKVVEWQIPAVMISHDHDLNRLYGDKTLLLRRGEIIE